MRERSEENRPPNEPVQSSVESVTSSPSEAAPIIHPVSRQQAIREGLLVDLTPQARAIGFHLPVACTQAVWSKWIVPPSNTRRLDQCESVRTEEMLWMIACAIRRARHREPTDRLAFKVIFLRAPGDQQVAELKAVCGYGDAGEPALTVMLPGEC